jgi:hypothetical protein
MSLPLVAVTESARLTVSLDSEHFLLRAYLAFGLSTGEGPDLLTTGSRALRYRVNSDNLKSCNMTILFCGQQRHYYYISVLVGKCFLQ